jgi:hypothetical protein
LLNASISSTQINIWLLFFASLLIIVTISSITFTSSSDYIFVVGTVLILKILIGLLFFTFNNYSRSFLNWWVNAMWSELNFIALYYKTKRRSSAPPVEQSKLPNSSNKIWSMSAVLPYPGWPHTYNSPDRWFLMFSVIKFEIVCYSALRPTILPSLRDEKIPSNF